METIGSVIDLDQPNGVQHHAEPAEPEKKPAKKAAKPKAEKPVKAKAAKPKAEKPVKAKAAKPKTEKKERAKRAPFGSHKIQFQGTDHLWAWGCKQAKAKDCPVADIWRQAFNLGVKKLGYEFPEAK